MGQTVIEKIISAHSDGVKYRNEIAIVNVDCVMASDTTAPLTIEAFKKMNGLKVWDANKIVLVIDHASPPPNEQIANLHSMMRDFAIEQGVKLYDVGEGICHQLMVENGHVFPGELVLGADSHACTYGALGAFGTGVGSTDLAGTLLTGKTWMKVPDTIKIVLNGELQPSVTAKDLILYLVGQLGIDGGTYKSLEFTGEVVHKLSYDSRLTVANMAIEMGAKAGLVDTQGLEVEYEFEHILPDEDAIYEQVLEFNVSALEPQVSVPNSPDLVKPISEVEGISVQQAFLGSCTNGRLEDLHEAAEVLNGKKVHPDVRMLIAPASRKVFNDALKDGTVQILSEAGATFLTSGCGPCVGTHMGVPGKNESVISSSNRNFKGRMGNPFSFIYLASPGVVAASALKGVITNPSSIVKKGEMV